MYRSVFAIYKLSAILGRKITHSHPHLNLHLKDFKQMRTEAPIKLSYDEIHHLKDVHQLVTWIVDPANTSISRTLKFENFQEAFSFMNAVAFVAEELMHHPEWSNCYNVVKVTLNTHDVEGLSMRDFIMAHVMDHLALEYQVKSAEGIQDSRQLDVLKIIDAWNQNYNKHQELESLKESLKQKSTTL